MAFLSRHRSFFLLLHRARLSSPSISTPRAIPAIHLAVLRDQSLPEDQHSRIARRWHFGHSHSHGDEEGMMMMGGKGEDVFKLGLVADISLAAGKAVTGYLSGSTAIIADAAHSASDIVLSGVAWLSYRAGKVPKDKDHPYGHGKFETLGTLGISCMLLATAGGIAWHAVDVLQGLLSAAPHIDSQPTVNADSHDHSKGGHHHGVDMEHPVLALSVTIMSISVKEWLYWVTKRAGEREGSGLMKANAWHHRADAVSSVVALIGVGGSILGVHFLDPLAGLFVSGMILKAGIESGYQSIMELVDAAVSQDVLTPFNGTIDHVVGVKGCHRLRGRRAGSSLHLDVHIEVDPFLSVSAAHNIGENVRLALQNSHKEVAEVFIHIDPSVAHAVDDIPKTGQKLSEQHLDVIPTSEQQDVLNNVSDVISSKFAEDMTVEHITYHSLRGRILVQVQVSMSPTISVEEAMRISKSAEAEVLKAAPQISQVSILLNLGSQIPSRTIVL